MTTQQTTQQSLQVPSYWYGNGYSKNFSKAVAIASQAAKDAEYALRLTLISEYPKDAHVRVVRHRGSYTGTVVGWDTYGCRVAVKNDTTGETRKWWSAHVEVL